MTNNGISQFNKFNKSLRNFQTLWKNHQGKKASVKVSAFDGSYAYPTHSAMKEKNVGSILHLVRRGKGGNKQLSTIQWESSLRGGPEPRVNVKPKRIKPNHSYRPNLSVRNHKRNLA